MFNSEKSGCTPGGKVVKISGNPVGDNEDPDAANEQIELPAKYNKNSVLNAAVDAEHRTFDFALRSK
jgi:hypothetical protein